jgi:putative ABC transport system permease protein
VQWSGYGDLALGAVRSHGLRSGLSALGIAIGIAAVILLTSISEGTRRFLLHEFTQFGTNILSIYPGRTETRGMPGAFGGTTHKLTIDDSEALKRVPGVEEVVPVAYGQARVEGNGRGRSVYVYGVTSQAPEAWKLEIGQGTFLPPGDPRRGALVAVLGARLKRELFGDANALGQFVRAAGSRLRVIGVMAPKGRMLDFDVDDAAYVHVATAMQMFNLDEVQEVDVLFTSERITDRVAEGIRRLLIDRHGGKEDFTIITQTAMLDALNNVMDLITFSIGAVAGISLLVGAIGVFTMMWIAVGERVSEIGLLPRREVGGLFLLEALGLSLLGGIAGLGGGLGIAWLLREFVPGLPVHPTASYVAVAFLVSFATGVGAGVAPARRAASLDPVEALRSE